MIAHNLPNITNDDVASVVEVLRSGWIATGNKTIELEKMFINYLGGGASCACSSGTAALYLALKSLNIGKNKKVALPAYSCSALLNAIYLAGADPILIDVEINDFNISIKELLRYKDSIDAVVAVNTFGVPSDIERIKHDFPLVIEDCCQSLGGKYFEHNLGTRGDVAIFSFYATKIITSGYGGLLWSRSKKIVNAAKDIINFDKRKIYKPRFNFQISDINSSLVFNQMKRLSSIILQKEEIAKKYLDAINGKYSVQSNDYIRGRIWHRFVILFNNKKQRDGAKKYLNNLGIQAVVPIKSCELLNRYLHLDYKNFPNSEKIASTSLSLPIHLKMQDDEVDFIARSIRRMSL